MILEGRLLLKAGCGCRLPYMKKGAAGGEDL